MLAFVLAISMVDTVPLAPGLVITHSVVIRPGVYRLAPAPGDSVVVRVRGSGIRVDFAGATLLGSDATADPDRRVGIGVLIEGGRNVTLANARIHGFKVGVLARGVHQLRLFDNDVSHNWKPRLWSGLGHESLVDWLSYHHNEKDEWLRYGAGFYLAGVEGGEIRGNTARQGMNGLLLARSDALRIWNNDFSFLSGLGIGLYRASGNTVMHNRVDWCIRGYVHGVYNRGQDSAALLLYEQSSRNVVAYNSMTHSGDGLFLWAGQSTMDTGKGGANDNLFFGNDFSFAATNGMEATFSRNRFIDNRIEGAHHGLWGGYSFDSEVRDNWFAGNVVGVAIEHGQDNRIAGNLFLGDQTAIRLWWNAIEPSDWGYPKHRDTRSRDYAIEANEFDGVKTALRLEHTQRARVRRNRFVLTDTALSATGDTTGFSADTWETSAGSRAPRVSWSPDMAHPAAPRPFPDGMNAMLPPGTPTGRATMIVDEWGPYDWTRPKLWPARAADSAYARGPMALVVLGPSGGWQLRASDGVASLSRTSGGAGDTLIVTPRAGPVTDWRVELAGSAGEAFSYSRFEAPIRWTLRVAPWDSTEDPRHAVERFRSRLATLSATREESRLDYMWYRPRLAGFPAERFGVLGEAEIELPPGEYELVTISDDGIRVWVDDVLAVDRWAAHESEVATAPIGAGRHRLRLEYYQVDGWVELRVEIRKRAISPAG